eukprot:14164778-Ditylum_brightwellii.AAC.1
MKYFDRAFDAHTMTLGPEHPLMALLHYKIGDIAFQVGDCEHGERSLDNFIQLCKGKRQENNFLVRNVFITLGPLYAAKKQKDSVNFYWMEALQKATEQNDDKNQHNLFGQKKSVADGSGMRSGSLHGSSPNRGKRKDSLPG